MAGLSRSEYERSKGKHAKKGGWLKLLWRIVVLALLIVAGPPLFLLIFGFFMVTTIVLGNWKMSIDLPDYK
jgi:ABC-type Fe3+ transport system permease subunit